MGESTCTISDTCHGRTDTRVPGFNSYSFPCSFRTPLPLLISQKRDI